MKSMIIKDIALWVLENSEILPRSKRNNFYSNTRLKIISYYCGMDSNIEKCNGFILQENENLDVKS